ncbi:hypothetical protein SAMN05443248_8005 [Bradyrhizobium erythrophlei]|uniref:Uncharacterized protein n=2 Tax=Bradyrhizobium erythrophlei TaxID=1437360 RepID=A0A1M5Y7D0_9BRAD|nr:hypothetical protein SAMN05443248_8005 [Bradyrhizobium erythrophlei]
MGSKADSASTGLQPSHGEGLRGGRRGEAVQSCLIAPKRLDGLEGWLRERFIRHRGNADVVRQDLMAEEGVAVSPRTLQRAVQPYRQALRAEALATTRFETLPGWQLQIDFGERLFAFGCGEMLGKRWSEGRLRTVLSYFPVEEGRFGRVFSRS